MKPKKRNKKNKENQWRTKTMITKAQQINNYLESKKKGTTRKNNENYKKEWTMKNIRKTDDNQRKHKKPIQRQMKS